MGVAGRCDTDVSTYGLTDDSYFMDCPVCPVEPLDLGGTFRLREVPRPHGSATRTFLVEDVYWIAGNLITGHGTYWMGEEDGRSQRLVLDLRIGGQVRRFDSGVVPLDVDPEWGIDIRICEYPLLWFYVDSRLFPRQD